MTRATLVHRKKTIEGVSLSGIVGNMGYHYSDIEIYSDGMVDAWGLNDLSQFAKRFSAKSLRVLCRMPDGEALGIHGLGSYRVVSGSWTHTPESYLRLVNKTLGKLNPDLANVYQITQREIDLNNKRRVIHASWSKPYRVTSEFGHVTEEGKKTHVFMVDGDRKLLVDVCVFKSGTVRITHPELALEIQLDELNALWKDRRFFTSIENPSEVSCGNLGVLTLVNDGYCVDAEAKLQEIHAEHESLQGHDRLEICRQAYHKYLEDPERGTREKLRESYERVPEHMRRYLGDMDSHDSDYRRVLYTEEKREV